jgi:hypothetical protein
MRMIYTANKWLYMGDLPSKNGDIGGCNETTSPKGDPPTRRVYGALKNHQQLFL